MKEREALDEIKRVLVVTAESDVRGLWTVLWDVAHAFPALSAAEAKRMTLAVVREALMEGQIVPGCFEDQDEETWKLVVWRTTVPESVERIAREWDALGRDPNPGEIVWFIDPDILPVVSFKRLPSQRKARP